MTPFVQATYKNASVQELMLQFKVDVAEAQSMQKMLLDSHVFVNDLYQVAVRGPFTPSTGLPGFYHVSVKRHDKEPVRDWRDMQQIKNELIGPEHEAVEIYPPESCLVDMANQFHLWVFAIPGKLLPMGWTKRMVYDEVHATDVGAKQRSYPQVTEAKGQS